MRITISHLRKIIKEEVSRALDEATVAPGLVYDAVNAARYMIANYSADLDELVSLRDANNKDVYKFKAAAEAALGEKNMNLGMQLMAFWTGSRGMSADDIAAEIEATKFGRRGTKLKKPGDVEPGIEGGPMGYWTGDGGGRGG